MTEARRARIAAPPRLDPDKLVFLDETWATMTRTRRRAPRGERLVCPVPHGRWRATTFLRGPRAERLVAPLVLDGVVDRPAFLAWVEQFLAPTLSTGDTVVADNLGSHKVSGVREAIEACGASLLCLPRTAPTPRGSAPKPIELASGKLKRLPCAAAARTADALEAAIGAAIGHFTAAECSNYLRHWGYAQSGR